MIDLINTPEQGRRDEAAFKWNLNCL